MTGPLLTTHLERVPQDAWIGVYWRWTGELPSFRYRFLDIWICVVPCFPLHITLAWRQRRKS